MNNDKKELQYFVSVSGDRFLTSSVEAAKTLLQNNRIKGIITEFDPETRSVVNLHLVHPKFQMNFIYHDKEAGAVIIDIFEKDDNNPIVKVLTMSLYSDETLSGYRDCRFVSTPVILRSADFAEYLQWSSTHRKYWLERK